MWSHGPYPSHPTISNLIHLFIMHCKTPAKMPIRTTGRNTDWNTGIHAPISRLTSRPGDDVSLRLQLAALITYMARVHLAWRCAMLRCLSCQFQEFVHLVIEWICRQSYDHRLHLTFLSRDASVLMPNVGACRIWLCRRDTGSAIASYRFCRLAYILSQRPLLG